jgi:hypothetical protein
VEQKHDAWHSSQSKDMFAAVPCTLAAHNAQPF